MDKRILITGASAGIGRACADRLHGQGWEVTGASRRGTSSGGWSPVVMDVDDDDSVAAAIAPLLADRPDTADRPALDAVVACAGWGLAGAVERTPLDEARAQLETNFWGSVRIVRHVLPVMRRQGHGRIVLVSSIGGVLGLPFQAYYSASKFALEGFAEALAYEVEPFGIGVTLVEPGNIRTEFTEMRRTAGVAGEVPAGGALGSYPPPGGDGGDPYRAAAAKAIGIMARDEAAGAPPDAVARVVQRVLASKRPPRRVSVGKLDERIGIVGKRLLPYRLFERAARGSLGV